MLQGKGKVLRPKISLVNSDYRTLQDDVLDLNLCARDLCTNPTHLFVAELKRDWCCNGQECLSSKYEMTEKHSDGSQSNTMEILQMKQRPTNINKKLRWNKYTMTEECSGSVSERSSIHAQNTRVVT